MSLDCGSGPLSCADWSLSNSLLVAAAVRSDVTVWDLSKMAPISKTYLRQVKILNHHLVAFLTMNLYFDLQITYFTVKTSIIPKIYIRICLNKQ